MEDAEQEKSAADAPRERGSTNKAAAKKATKKANAKKAAAKKASSRKTAKKADATREKASAKKGTKKATAKKATAKKATAKKADAARRKTSAKKGTKKGAAKKGTPGKAAKAADSAPTPTPERAEPSAPGPGTPVAGNGRGDGTSPPASDTGPRAPTTGVGHGDEASPTSDTGPPAPVPGDAPAPGDGAGNGASPPTSDAGPGDPVPGDGSGDGAPPSPSPGSSRKQRREQARAKWGFHGRTPMLMLAGVGLVDALDRGVIGGVVTALQQDLGVNDFQMGLLDSAYIITGLLFAVPAGYLSDRARRTKVIAVIMALWTVFTAGTAAVRAYWQAFVVRTAVGLGDTIDDPAAQSLLADYYPAKVRARAYSYYRATPTVGRALGIAGGGIVGAILGWRAAFLIVAIPGILLAVGVWRLREPGRGESDNLTRAGQVPTADEAETRTQTKVWADIRQLMQIGSLRALVFGTAVGSGILQGLGFWAVAYHERHSGLDAGVASASVGGLILIGSVAGTLTGGQIADRVRGRIPGAEMLGAGVSLGLGGLFLAGSLIDGIPVWSVRVPMQAIAVFFIVAALPATFAMTSEVVPSSLRGTGFSLVKVSSTIIGTVAPPLVGWISDLRTYVTEDGREVGDLSFGFMMAVPLILAGSLLLLRGRTSVDADKEAASAETEARRQASQDDAGD